MTRFIELEKRYGVQPWQSTIEYDSSTGETYVTGSPADPIAYAGFKEMLKAFGMTESDKSFPQQEGQEMLDALDEAIQKRSSEVGSLTALPSSLHKLPRGSAFPGLGIKPKPRRSSP